eukprot:974979-Amphidinium_carterae.1
MVSLFLKVPGRHLYDIAVQPVAAVSHQIQVLTVTLQKPSYWLQQQSNTLAVGMGVLCVCVVRCPPSNHSLRNLYMGIVLVVAHLT